MRIYWVVTVIVAIIIRGDGIVKKYKSIILWIIITISWTILTLILSKLFSISKGYNIQDALVIISFGIIIIGLLLVMGQGAARNPIEFSSKSHELFSAVNINKLLTNNHGEKYGYSYSWKFYFNGYSIIVAGVLCILIDIIIII